LIQKFKAHIQFFGESAPQATAACVNVSTKVAKGAHRKLEKSGPDYDPSILPSISSGDIAGQSENLDFRFRFSQARAL